MAAKRHPIDLVLTLRTPQVQYLEYLADRDAGPLSDAFNWLVRDRMRSDSDPPSPTAYKVRKHVTVANDVADYMDKLGARWGLPRSDVARRLIDDAEAKDREL